MEHQYKHIRTRLVRGYKVRTRVRILPEKERERREARTMKVIMMVILREAPPKS